MRAKRHLGFFRLASKLCTLLHETAHETKRFRKLSNVRTMLAGQFQCLPAFLELK